MASGITKVIPMEDVIRTGIKQIEDNGYEPHSIWMSFDNENIYITTTDEDLSKYAKLIKKFK